MGSPVRAMRLLLVDDHELARAGMRSLLGGERDLEVVGEAGNGAEAVAACRELKPDLVLMDVRMPDMDGLTATRAIKGERPETRVIVITVYENPDYLVEALKAGAAGYLLKGATRREVVGAVRQVLRGETYVNGPLAAQVLQRMVGPGGGGSRVTGGGVGLTEREAEVLRLLAKGQTNREIAGALVVSVTTVKTHVEHILAKLAVGDRTQAAVRAVELGLLPRDSSLQRRG